MWTETNIAALDDLSLQDGLATVVAMAAGPVVFSSSLGQEDQVITDAICRAALPIRIFTIDTGRLFPETYELIEKTNARYQTQLQVFFPAASEVEAFVAANGINGFYESVDNRKHCCQVRKVQPLHRALAGAAVWITGLRAEQSANRQQMKRVEWDAERQLYKYNPLLHWSYDTMMEYLHTHKVPYNTLHDKGYRSIGCAPCTRAIAPGEDARAGRWWWEQSQKECGLHATVEKNTYA